ncbi:MAG: hypothetical protein AMK71_05685 [Nitrospira bacterium SG8_35_4]|nr:MAG: hypothetical protein AMK71_05685 [Nitrospira bacterium SG8_35_4]
MKLSKNMLLALISCLLMISCAHHSVPKQVPEVGMDIVGSYDQKYSVDLINDQPDTSENLYWSMGVHRYYANYNTWTQFFIDNYTKELEKRGVDVSDDSPNKVKVRLSDFAFMQGFAVVRSNIKIKLESPDRSWVKEWVESDKSGWSGGRALGSTVYRAIERLLRDEEVMNRMKI